MYALLYMNFNTSIKNMKASAIKISHCNSFTWAEEILQVQSKATCKRHIHKRYPTDTPKGTAVNSMTGKVCIQCCMGRQQLPDLSYI